MLPSDDVDLKTLMQPLCPLQPGYQAIFPGGNFQIWLKMKGDERWTFEANVMLVQATLNFIHATERF